MAWPEKKQKPEKAQNNLVRMERSEEDARQSGQAGGPLTADVHPDEVANYNKHGWEIAIRPYKIRYSNGH